MYYSDQSMLPGCDPQQAHLENEAQSKDIIEEPLYPPTPPKLVEKVTSNVANNNDLATL
jgi:hypothetical protein